MTNSHDAMALDARGGPDAGALILPDARRIALDRDVVIGRAPVAPDDSPAARSVSLGTPMVSKSHALIGRSRGVVWVIDLDSSNGTEIVDPSGAATVVTPGERTPIAPGCHLRLGAVVVITVERPVDRDDDVTVEREIDASASGPPPTMIVPQPAPSSPVQPLPAQPPPPAPTAPRPAPPPFFASAPAYSAPATAQQPVVPPAGSPGAHTLPAPMPTGTGVQRGRSSAHVVGALVVLVWGMVSGWRLLEIGPDVLFENLNGWPSRFFSQVSRVEFEFVEFFSVVPTPDVLSPIVYVLAATVCVLALAVLVSANRTLRLLTVGAVGVVLFSMIGFAVDYFVAVGADSLEFTFPNFVLPLIGCGLLLWPSGAVGSATPPFAPQAQPGVFYAPQQSPPPPGGPPFGGQP